MCFNQPSSLPALLGMASLAVLSELAGMGISMTLLACFSNPYKLSLSKFRSFGHLMAFDTCYGIMFSTKGKSGIGAVSIDEPSACPPLLRMTSFTTICELAVVWITVTFRATGTYVIKYKSPVIAGI